MTGEDPAMRRVNTLLAKYLKAYWAAFDKLNHKDHIKRDDCDRCQANHQLVGAMQVIKDLRDDLNAARKDRSTGF